MAETSSYFLSSINSNYWIALVFIVPFGLFPFLYTHVEFMCSENDRRLWLLYSIPFWCFWFFFFSFFFPLWNLKRHFLGSKSDRVCIVWTDLKRNRLSALFSSTWICVSGVVLTEFFCFNFIWNIGRDNWRWMTQRDNSRLQSALVGAYRDMMNRRCIWMETEKKLKSMFGFNLFEK